jgi:anti-sigma B factor antagonist
VNLSISTETNEEAVVVHVGGDLDVFTAPRLKDTLTKAMVDGRRLVLDLSQVHFMDDPYLLKIFHITGFDGMFSIYPEVAEALSQD